MKNITIRVIQVENGHLLPETNEPFAVVYNNDDHLVYVFCEESRIGMQHLVEDDLFEHVAPGIQQYTVETRMLEPVKLSLVQQRETLASAMAAVEDIYKHECEEEGTTAYDLYQNLSTMWNQVLCEIYCIPDNEWPSRWWTEDRKDFIDFSQTQMV